MRQPNTLRTTDGTALAVADYYEYSMAHANMEEVTRGRESVFDFLVRRLPANKVVGRFERDGIRYDELAERDYLVNAGLEQAAAHLLQTRGSRTLRDYFKDVQGVDDERFLDWVGRVRFEGDLYGLPEGTVFFAHEPQLRLHERFEEAQLFESILLSTINPQTNVATTASDIAELTDRILLEGGSRRGQSPPAAIQNSRAARIGGFTASSNVAYGLLHDERVGGTHGHSYVMVHPDEYAAFTAQARHHGDDACFLLDTYDVQNALETALRVVEEEDLGRFALRIDSGDLLAQARWIHRELGQRGIARDRYRVVASDDLTAEKIRRLEEEGADIDKYLVGTFLVNPPKPVPGVFKLCAYRDDAGVWRNEGKFSQDPGKATLPGVKQVHRITGPDGYYRKDVIALLGEDISDHLAPGDSSEELLVPIILQGRQVYDFPSVDEISDCRRRQLARFRDIASYEVVLSEGIRREREALEERRRQKMEVYA